MIKFLSSKISLSLMDFKKDFPLLTNHPDTIYLDSAATTQKPSYVIEGVTHYLEHDYANIHRWWYDLSVASEELYREARKRVASLINGRDDEIIFTSNSTSASNLLIQSLVLSGVLKAGDKILLSITSHHASLVPRQLVAKFMDIEIIFIGIDKERNIDVEDFKKKYDDRVKVVSLPFVSNVVGQLDPLEDIKKLLRDDTLYILDASQAITHIPVDVKKLGCDFLFFTGHKLFAYTWIGVLRWKQKHLKSLQPAIVGGGAIESVTSTWYTLLEAPDKFEPWTPNLVGAVSLLKAIEYMEQVGERCVKSDSFNASQGSFSDWPEGSLSNRYQAIQQIERPLIDYTLERFRELESIGVKLIWTTDPSQKIGLFSFILPTGKSPAELGQYMAKEQICIRCWGQCAQPFHELLGNLGTCRISYSLYTTQDDISKFFDIVKIYLAK